MELKRQFLCNLDAVAAAKELARGKPLGNKTAHLREAAEYILDAVKCGWFVLPARRNGQYTKHQFSMLSAFLKAHPGLPGALATAKKAHAHALREFKGAEFELFGSTSNGRLPSPVTLATSAAHRCPRMPLNFVAGAFGLEQACDLLDDVTGNCLSVHRLCEVLGTPGLYDPLEDLAAKIERLVRCGQGHLAPAVAKSVHKLYLDREEQRALSRVVYSGACPTEFQRFLLARAKAREQTNTEHWQRIKRKISAVASVLGEVRSFDHGAVTKQLRAQLGNRFKIVFASGRYTIVMDDGPELGSTSDAQNTFELINWVISLDSNMTQATSDVYGYFDACSMANAKLQEMRSSMAA